MTLNEPPDPWWMDDDFWAAFDDPPEPEVTRRPPWYRRMARWLAAFAIAGMLATGALVPWGRFFDERSNVVEPADIVEVADAVVDASPYGWLVTDVRVRPIDTPEIGGFVSNSPPDGVVFLDFRSWDPDDLRSVVDHEIGHLIDFAVWGRDASAFAQRRGGLDSEPWAECASVHAGSRNTDGSEGRSEYHCTDEEYEVFARVINRIEVICAPWTEEGCVELTLLPTGN